MGELWRRLGALFHRGRLDRDLEEEMRIHLEMKAGESEDPAAARHAFGNPLLLRERSADVWAWRWLLEASQDVRFGLRLLRRNPGFTFTALLSLALGMGVTTAVFTLADAILWRPLSAPHPDQLVSVYHQSQRDTLISSSWPDYEYYRDHNEVFSGLAAYLRLPMVVRTREAAEEVRGELVSANYFPVLGVQAIAGCVLREDDPGPVTVLSYAYWQRRFNRDPGVIGRVVAIGGHDFTVIGVAPRSFRGVVMDWGGPPDLWAPITAYREAVPVLAKFDVMGSWAMQSFPLVGRLRPGVPVERARAALSVLSAQAAPLREQGLKRRIDLRPVVLPLQQARFWPTYRGAVTRFLTVLAGVVALALLIACFNVSNLLLALAAKRRKEIAVRLAMGVSRSRLVCQLLIESLVLSILGGAIGLAVAAVAMRFLTSFPKAFGAPVVLAAGLDPSAFVCAFLVSLASAILFGLAPARQATRVELTSALKTDAGGAGSRSVLLRDALVAAQVALSLVVLIGAGLVTRTLRNALAEDVIRDPGSLLVARFDLSGWGYDEARAQLFYRQVVDHVQAIPGVRGAALVWTLPLSGTRGETDIFIDDNQAAKADRNGISPGYFKVSGLPVLRGREFTERDGERAPPVAVVNERAAERFWPGQEPLGKHVRLARDKRCAEVVGVVRDGQFRGLRDPVRPSVYFPVEQSFLWATALEVRTAGEPMQYVGALRQEFRALDRELPLSAVMSWESHREEGLGQERLAAALLGGLAVLALVLAALALTRYTATLLYKVSTTDTVTFSASGLLLLAIAAAAAYVPARRATRIEPTEALRYE